MNKMIIAVFNTEEQAYEGLASVKELHNNNDLTVYATAVINKNENGEIKVKQISEKGPTGTALGAICGALIGMVGGPATIAMGTYAGMLSGMFFDIDDGKVNSTFLEEVSEALFEGKTAVIADVIEEWEAPVNTKLEHLDAIVYRRNKSEIAEDQFNRELDELNTELNVLDQELENANDNAKAEIQKKIELIKEKNTSLNILITSKIETLKKETEAKSKILDTQLKKANNKRKNKLEKQKIALRKNYKARNKKLVAASVKASEFLL